MATEIPHLSCLQIPAQIGNREDFSKGFTALAKAFPRQISCDKAKAVISNIDYQFVTKLKEAIKSDKVKLSEEFELHLMFYLGWAFAKRLAHLEIVKYGGYSGFDLSPWEEGGEDEVVSADS